MKRRGIGSYAYVALGVIAMALQADQVTVYNGTPQGITIAIAQGKFQDGNFYVVGATKGKEPVKVMAYEVPPLTAVQMTRPARRLGYDTVLLRRDGQLDSLLGSIMMGHYFEPKEVHYIGQLGNKKIFLGPLGLNSKPIYGGTIGLYKSYKDLNEAMKTEFGTAYTPLAENKWTSKGIFGKEVTPGEQKGLESALSRSATAAAGWALKTRKKLSLQLDSALSALKRTTSRAARSTRESVTEFVEQFNRDRQPDETLLIELDESAYGEPVIVRVGGQPPRSPEDKKLVEKIKTWINGLRKKKEVAVTNPGYLDKPRGDVPQGEVSAIL